ncbi:MAG: type II toxin-antitoxin system Phd/YefM family antitoxin [Streptococcaceae bacterium]|nr:type II toxin-antitoxin system Phd/YefM family antitoxin [Streptococcaceae bacterium]
MEKVKNMMIASVTDVRKDFTNVMNELEKEKEIYVFNNNRPKAILVDYEARKKELEAQKELEDLFYQMMNDEMFQAIDSLDIEPLRMNYNESKGYFEPADWDKKRNNAITEDW